jgi:hypothetical protein
MIKHCFDGKDGDIQIEIWTGDGKLIIRKGKGCNVLEIMGVGNSVADTLHIQPHVANVVKIAIAPGFRHFDEAALNIQQRRVRRKNNKPSGETVGKLRGS